MRIIRTTHLPLTVIAAALPFLLGLHCVKGEPKKDVQGWELTIDERIFVANESCDLGDAVVKKADGSFACQRFLPIVTRPACQGYSASSHRNAIDQTAQAVPNTRDNRFAAAEKMQPNGLKRELEGRLALLRTGIGVSVQSPPSINVNVDAKAEAINVLVSIAIGYTILTDTQVACLKAQTIDEVKRDIGLSPTDTLLGFVSRVHIGFAHFLELRSADLKLTARDIVKVNADRLQLTTTYRGSMNNEYTEEYNKMISAGFNGLQAYQSAQKIVSMANGVIGGSSIAIEYMPIAQEQSVK